MIDVVPEVHHVTSYDLLYRSQILDRTTLLADLLSSVNQKSLQFELKSKAYDAKSIIEHVAKIRDIVALVEQESFGINSGVSKINELELGPIPEAKPVEEKKESKEGEETEPGAAELPSPSPEEEAEISETVSKFFGKLPSNYFSPTSITQPAVRALHLSSWNPVPLNYRVKGHLVYLVLQTLESETLHITGSSSGFFINKSSSNKFDPSPRENSNSSFTLYELISKSSKNFVNQIKSNNEKLNKIDPVTFLRPQTAFLSNPWITKPTNPTPDFGKTQFEDNTQRDFNDEFQSIKDFPTQTLSDRILRERLLAKTSYEFSAAAVKGALAVLNGAIAPMNPGEKELDQIYLHNGIFYSFAVDASGFFATRGVNLAARASTNQDLKAIKYWNSVDPRGIYTLLTTVVDYAGRRVLCQSPVPGLFTSSEPKEVKNEETGQLELVDGEPLTKIDYGYDDTTDSFKSNAEFVKDLEPIRKAIHYKRIEVNNGDGEAVTNAEIKGMFGTDKRKYVIDLFNTTPLDVEFKDQHYKPDQEGSYPHSQVVTRFEAVQEWWAQSAKVLIKEEADKKGIDLSAPLKDGEEPPTVTIDDEKLLFTPDNCHTDENVRSLSKFIKSDLIPRFLNQFDSVSNIVPADGTFLSSLLHKFGINIRYLGYIAEAISSKIEESIKEEQEALVENEKANKLFEEKLEAKQKKALEEAKAKAEAVKNGEEIPKSDDKSDETEEEEDDEVDGKPISKSVQFQNLYAVVIQELIARASKHILRDYALSLPISLVPSLVSHFHNCLLGQAFNPAPAAVYEDNELYSEKDLEFTKLTPESVQQLIVENVKLWYRYDLPSNWTAEHVKPLQIQREIALKFGIQWQQREYFFNKDDFENAQKTAVKDKKSRKHKSVSPEPVAKKNVFNPEDVSFAPLIKHSVTGSTSAEQIFEAGRQLITGEDQSKREEGLALISEAISVYEQVYGQVHPEVAKVYATLSQLYQELGLKREATLLSRRAVAVSERAYGLDSHDTLVALLNLAYLEAESGSILNSTKVYALLTQIWNSIFDNRHVSIPTITINATLNLQKLGLYKEANRLLETLIKLSTDVHGKISYTTGFLKFRRAYLLANDEKFKEAGQEASDAYEIVKNVSGPKHYLTKQTKLLFEQLINYQKIMSHNEQINKQKLKEEAKEQNLKLAGKPKSKTAAPKKEFEDKSVDEILQYVMGNKSGPSKKNKKKAQNN